MMSAQPHVRDLAAISTIVMLSIGAWAQDGSHPPFSFDVAGRKLLMPLPTGFCSFSDRIPSERDFVDSQQKGARQVGSQILLLFVSCGDLQKLRTTGTDRAVSYGNYSVPLKPDGSIASLAPGIDRSLFVRNQVASAPKFDAAAIVDAVSRATNEVGVKVDRDTARIGFIASSDDAAYMARFSEVRVNNSTAPTMRVAGMTSITEFFGIPIFVTFSRSMDGAETYDQLLDDARNAVGP
jgi:hypothetical protein